MGRNQVSLQTKQRVPISPEIVCKLGTNVTAAYYYTQLLYYDRYSDKNSDGWFDRNSREIEADIGLNRRQQEHSRKKLEELGWIETQSVRGGLKPTMMFRVLIHYKSP
jgi:hypothetical protein